VLRCARRAADSEMARHARCARHALPAPGWCAAQLNKPMRQAHAAARPEGQGAAARKPPPVLCVRGVRAVGACAVRSEGGGVAVARERRERSGARGVEEGARGVGVGKPRRPRSRTLYR